MPFARRAAQAWTQACAACATLEAWWIFFLARGALVGLAVGDALGTTNEFQPAGSFEPITGMVGGGVFGLEPGQWTDDTSMALCLADSLLAQGRYDSFDVMERYERWYSEGYRSSTGVCFDIGN